MRGVCEAVSGAPRPACGASGREDPGRAKYGGSPVSAPAPRVQAQIVPRFTVESSLAASSAALDTACDRARLTERAGRGVRYVDTTYQPGDETVIHVFDAPSEAALDEAGRRAGLQFERIVPAVDVSADRRKETRR